MNDAVLGSVDNPSPLVEEIARLRAEVERLQGRVEELDSLAHRDTLTPLANRRGLVRELETMIARRARHGIEAALLFIDLNDLKQLNDRFGHGAGDAALVHVAKALIEGTRGNDCAARIGGDEYCVLLDHAGEQAAVDTAERLIASIAAADFRFQDHPLPLSVAIGYTLVEPGDTPDAALARADRAMYRVKSAA
jgi:diguanylate cyclase (GGDEF)-like protein